jgi:uncharacterized membrane protein
MALRSRLWIVLSCFLLLPALPVQAAESSVKAILFYDPGCAQCAQLINTVLPPLLEQYNQSLLIFKIDVTNQKGHSLYAAAIADLGIPQDQQGVPLMIVETVYFSGLESIQSQFPPFIAQSLAQGGTQWPTFPGLMDALTKAGLSTAPASTVNKFLADQPANSLAVIVLVGLILSLIGSILFTFRAVPKSLEAIPGWVFPALLIIGVGLASYLTYTELTRSEVFCGGISHCQTVQDSQYSKIMGIMSIGEFGVIGYCCIGLSWIVHRLSRGMQKGIAAIAMFGFAIFGVSFSIYLTFLEPFVIGATCLWCLSSATIMGLILPLTTGPVRAAILESATSVGNLSVPNK